MEQQDWINTLSDLGIVPDDLAKLVVDCKRLEAKQINDCGLLAQIEVLVASKGEDYMLNYIHNIWDSRRNEP